MGFATGFTGGVTLTLSLAYLSVLAHQRNREQQGRSLRAQALTIQSIIDPIPQPLPPTRSEVAASQRAASIEVAKDKWNGEVESAVRWVQHTDWNDVREGMEAQLGHLWAKAFGSIEEDGEKVASKLEPLVDKVKVAAEEKKSGAAAAAKDAYAKANRKEDELKSVAKDRAQEAKVAAKKKASTAKDEVKDKAAEGQGVIASALGRGRERAQEMVGKVKNVVGIAEDKVETAVDGILAPEPTSVQKALHQRFVKPSTADNRTPAEVLRERYTPMDEQNSKVLRGI